MTGGFGGGWTVEVWRGRRDRDGDRALAKVATHDGVGLRWEPGRETDPSSGREWPITVGVLVFTTAVDIEATDEVRILGLPGAFGALGDIAPVRSPLDGWEPGAIVRVRKRKKVRS